VLFAVKSQLKLLNAQELQKEVGIEQDIEL